ncbi:MULTISPECIES: hypothetical protein [Mesorhizobium]|uniref:hypothetical protein n=1 Tax=Mesorhizobium TaxID=68287 RepID=UPI00059B0811|nr:MULTISPECIES: hypothetical protein [Mesorhizobium]TPN50213.1 hypothetical protein FJ976_16035 [Mesorhizobium sp. B1-1-9]TPN53237.1 hypothetical protein FJ978_10715 [Mesorhizobium sp. B1-1-7]
MFDWQLTPFETVLEYLRRDFRGMFERSDLVLRKGVVWNERFQTEHQHEFPADLSPEQLNALYSKARLLHYHWCAATTEALDNPLSTLFVVGVPMSEAIAGQLSDEIAKRCSHKAYLVLDGPEGDYPIGGSTWAGNRKLWAEHLSSFTIEPASLVASAR